MKNIINTLLIFIFSLIIVLNSFTISTYALNKNEENIKESFYKSINYDPTQSLLTFTIPEAIPKGCKFYLHVSGRIHMGNKSNAMSFHAFDKESLSFSWKRGKTYTYSLNSEGLIEFLLVFGLIDENGEELLYEVHIYPNGWKIIEEEVNVFYFIQKFNR